MAGIDFLVNDSPNSRQVHTGVVEGDIGNLRYRIRTGTSLTIARSYEKISVNSEVTYALVVGGENVILNVLSLASQNAKMEVIIDG
jgi:hypothetical protein